MFPPRKAGVDRLCAAADERAARNTLKICGGAMFQQGKTAETFFR
jgi:hypothetical protein